MAGQDNTNFVTWDDYFKHIDKTYPEEVTQIIKDNAADLLYRVNRLLAVNGVKRPVSSGFRRFIHNVNIGGKPGSAHLIGKAVDILDTDKSLKTWCVANKDLLVECDLYMEDPASTPTWVHLQSRPPASRRRIFKP